MAIAILNNKRLEYERADEVTSYKLWQGPRHFPFKQPASGVMPLGKIIPGLAGSRLDLTPRVTTLGANYFQRKYRDAKGSVTKKIRQIKNFTSDPIGGLKDMDIKDMLSNLVPSFPFSGVIKKEVRKRAKQLIMLALEKSGTLKNLEKEGRNAADLKAWEAKAKTELKKDTVKYSITTGVSSTLVSVAAAIGAVAFGFGAAVTAGYASSIIPPIVYLTYDTCINIAVRNLRKLIESKITDLKKAFNPNDVSNTIEYVPTPAEKLKATMEGYGANRVAVAYADTVRRRLSTLYLQLAGEYGGERLNQHPDLLFDMGINFAGAAYPTMAPTAEIPVAVVQAAIDSVLIYLGGRAFPYTLTFRTGEYIKRPGLQPQYEDLYKLSKIYFRGVAKIAGKNMSLARYVQLPSKDTANLKGFPQWNKYPNLPFKFEPIAAGYNQAMAELLGNVSVFARSTGAHKVTSLKPAKPGGGSKLAPLALAAGAAYMALK